MVNILSEFEKRYTGYQEDNASIYKDIADTFGLDVDEVTDYVLIHRYEDDEVDIEALTDEGFFENPNEEDAW